MTREAGMPPWMQTQTFDGSGVFLAIQAEPQRAADLPVIMMKKFVENWFPGTNELTRARDGRVIILARDEKTAKRAEEKAKDFYGICSIKITRVESLNQCQGIIFDRGLLSVTIDDMLAELQSAKVSKIERIETMKDGKKSPNGMHVLTFDRRSLPETINAFFVRYQVRKYYPNPMRCQRCFAYGHTRNWCKQKEEFCGECAAVKKEQHVCSSEKHCRNCEDGGNPPHGSLSRDCPIRKKEIDILHLKIDNKISYQMAKKMYDSHHTGEQGSYSSAVKKNLEAEAQSNAEKLEGIKKTREDSEKILEELTIETEKLKKVAEALLRKKEERDRLLKLINQLKDTTSSMTTEATDEPTTDSDDEGMETETTEQIKRSTTEAHPTSRKPENQVNTTTRNLKIVEDDFLIEPDYYDELPMHMRRTIRRKLEDLKDPLNPPVFWKKPNQILSREPQNEKEEETAKQLYDFLILRINK